MFAWPTSFLAVFDARLKEETSSLASLKTFMALVAVLLAELNASCA
jgi:hypothetical protein